MKRLINLLLILMLLPMIVFADVAMPQKKEIIEAYVNKKTTSIYKMVNDQLVKERDAEENEIYVIINKDDIYEFNNEKYYLTYNPEYPIHNNYFMKKDDLTIIEEQKVIEPHESKLTNKDIIILCVGLAIFISLLAWLIILLINGRRLKNEENI